MSLVQKIIDALPVRMASVFQPVAGVDSSGNSQLLGVGQDGALRVAVSGVSAFQGGINSVGTGSTSSLEAASTVGVFARTLITLRNDATGKLENWLLLQSTATTDVPSGRMRPLDFDPTTNPKVWYLQAGVGGNFSTDNNGNPLSPLNLGSSSVVGKLAPAHLPFSSMIAVDSTLADGVTDTALGIQIILNNAAPGSVVLLDSTKRWAISPGIISVPAFVTLTFGREGHAGRQVANYGTGQPAISGTVSGGFNLLGGVGASDTDPAYITLAGGCATLTHASFFDTNNPSTLTTPVTTPYAVRATAYDCTIEDVELVNTPRGVDVQAGRVWVQHLTGNPLVSGLRVDRAGDFNHIENIHFVDSFVRNTALAPWFYANSLAVELLSCDGVFAREIGVFAYHIGLHLAVSTSGGSGSYGIVSDSFFDGGKYGVLDDGTQDVGLNLTSVHCSPGGLNDPATASTFRGYLATATKTGNTKLTNCYFWAAGDANVEIQGGGVNVHDCFFTSYGSYAILISGGFVDEGENTFNRAPSAAAISVSGSLTAGSIAGTSHLVGSTGAPIIVNTAPGVVIGLTDKRVVQYANNDFTNTGGQHSHIALTNSAANAQSIIAAIFGTTRGGQLRFDYQGNTSLDPGQSGGNVILNGGAVAAKANTDATPSLGNRTVRLSNSSNVGQAILGADFAGALAGQIRFDYAGNVVFEPSGSGSVKASAPVIAPALVITPAALPTSPVTSGIYTDGTHLYWYANGQYKQLD